MSAELLLRPWSMHDAAGLRAAIDEDVDHLRPWMTWTLEEPVSLERTHARLAHWIAQASTGEAFRFAITPVEGAAAILGAANLYDRVGGSALEIGYWVRRSAVRRGVAGAAVSALVNEAFEHHGVDRLVIRCDDANVASRAFARTLGFAEGARVERRHPDGSARPVLEFELTLDRYRDALEPAFIDRARRVDLRRSCA